MSMLKGNRSGEPACACDVTSQGGMKKALEMVNHPAMRVMFPGFFLGKYLFDKGTEYIKGNSETTKTTIQEQRDAAVEIIKAGKHNNAESLELTLDQAAGVDIGSEIEGIPLKFSIGNSGKMTIHVKYK